MTKTGNALGMPTRLKKVLWFFGGVVATLSLTVLLTNFIHPDLYSGLRGNNFIMSIWNSIVGHLTVGSITPLMINAVVAMLSAALPMYYAVVKSPIYSDAGRRKKVGILLPLLNLPVFAVYSASVYKPFRDPEMSLSDRTFVNVLSEWGNNLMYGGAIGLLSSLVFCIAVIVLVKKYRLAIGVTLAVLLICQIIGVIHG